MKRGNMSWASVIFVLTWKAKMANKKENVYAASRCQEIKEATNSISGE